MKKQLHLLLFLWISFHINAQDIFRPSGQTATLEAHLAFMNQYAAEAEKRALLWEVPTLAVQVIASVQSGAGSQPHYNFGHVLPHPGITRFDKFATLQKDGLINCIKASRGLEAIAMGLFILKSNNKNTIVTDEDYLRMVFGAGGDLESMATEAALVYSAYTNTEIRFLENQPARLTTALDSTLIDTKVIAATVVKTPIAIENLTQTDSSNNSTTRAEIEILENVDTVREIEIADTIEQISLTTEVQIMTPTPVDTVPKTANKTTELSMAEQEAAIAAAHLKASIKAEQELIRLKREQEEKKKAAEAERLREKEKEIIPVKKRSRKIRFGIQAGINATKILASNDDREVASDDSYKLGYQGGLTIDIPITTQLSFASGLQYAVKGSKLERESLNNTITTTISNLNYIQIPLQLKQVATNGKTEFFFQAGPYLAYAINGKRAMTQTIIGGGEETSTTNLTFGTEATDDFNPLDYGLGAGFGIQWKGIQLGLNYDLGLANISNIDVNGLTLKNRGASLFLGYGF